MTLLLAPFWAFGKEKSTDQAETEKGEQEAPEWKLPICYVLDRDNQIADGCAKRRTMLGQSLYPRRIEHPATQ